MLAVVFCAVPGNHLPGPAYKFSDTHGWQLSLAVAVLPALCFGAALLRFRPPSLFGEAASRPELKGRRWHFWQPFVILWSCCFLLGGAVQGGTGNVIVGSYAWVSGMTPVVPLMILTCVMGLSCAVSCLLSRRYSPVALLCCSCLVLLIALVLMMREVKPAIDEFAFVLWAFGAGAIFPGLIGVAADRFPRGGARLLGVMTALYAFGAAVLSRATAAVYKHFETSAAAGLGWNIGDLREAYFEQVRGSGLTLANVSLEAVHRSMARPTLIAVVLCVIFGLVWLADKRRGGYHVERLDIDPLEVYAGVASDKPL
jgi:MFS family permease